MKNIEENLEFEDCWFHGHSGNSKVSVVKPPSVKQPFFVAKNLEYAMEFAKMKFEEGNYTQSDTTSKANFGDGQILVVRLSPSINIFDPKEHVNVMKALFGKHFDKILEEYDFKLYLIIRKLSEILNYLHEFDMLSLIVDYDNADAVMKKMIDDYEQNTGKKYGSESSSFEHTIYNNEVNIFFIETIFKLFKGNPILQNNASSAVLSEFGFQELSEKIYQKIVNIAHCNAIASREVTTGTGFMNNGKDVSSSCLILLDVSALSSVIPKLLTYDQAENFQVQGAIDNI